jgi:hypothetical protein
VTGVQFKGRNSAYHSFYELVPPKVYFGRHAVQQHLVLDAASFLFIIALPLGEMLPLAGDRAVAGAVAVADTEKGVMVEGVIDARLTHVVGLLLSKPARMLR